MVAHILKMVWAFLFFQCPFHNLSLRFEWLFSRSNRT